MNKQDAKNEYKNKDLVRRRFYLSKSSLELLDEQAEQLGISCSMYLDSILKSVKK